jgi:hypothetical protein
MVGDGLHGAQLAIHSSAKSNQINSFISHSIEFFSPTSDNIFRRTSNWISSLGLWRSWRVSNCKKSMDLCAGITASLQCYISIHFHFKIIVTSMLLNRLYVPQDSLSLPAIHTRNCTLFTHNACKRSDNNDVEVRKKEINGAERNLHDNVKSFPPKLIFLSLASHFHTIIYFYVLF